MLPGGGGMLPGRGSARGGGGSTIVGGRDGTCLLLKAQARWTTRATASMHLNKRHVPQNSGLVVIVSPAWRGGASCARHLKGTACMSSLEVLVLSKIAIQRWIIIALHPKNSSCYIHPAFPHHSGNSPRLFREYRPNGVMRFVQRLMPRLNVKAGGLVMITEVEDELGQRRCGSQAAKQKLAKGVSCLRSRWPKRVPRGVKDERRHMGKGGAAEVGSPSATVPSAAVCTSKIFGVLGTVKRCTQEHENPYLRPRVIVWGDMQSAKGREILWTAIAQEPAKTIHVLYVYTQREGAQIAHCCDKFFPQLPNHPGQFSVRQIRICVDIQITADLKGVETWCKGTTRFLADLQELNGLLQRADVNVSK
ncbi:hypothetical protein K438DRAFT_1759970 [Mycena galopus ATCC 62051]|nr:hypothetical protein K438DRAFT_1759970 [Mycena galopus ATCC 62051]